MEKNGKQHAGNVENKQKTLHYMSPLPGRGLRKVLIHTLSTQ